MIKKNFKKMFLFWLTVFAGFVTLLATIKGQWDQIQDGKERERQYKELLDKTNNIVEKQGKALEILTGGNSFCYFSINKNGDRLEYYLMHQTINGFTASDLHGVRAAISSCSKEYEITDKSFFRSLDLSPEASFGSQHNGEPNPESIIGAGGLGDIKINHSQSLGNLLSVDLLQKNILIKFEALNGEWTEVVSYDNGKIKHLVVKKENNSLVKILEK